MKHSSAVVCDVVISVSSIYYLHTSRTGIPSWGHYVSRSCTTLLTKLCSLSEPRTSSTDWLFSRQIWDLSQGDFSRPYESLIGLTFSSVIAIINLILVRTLHVFLSNLYDGNGISGWLYRKALSLSPSSYSSVNVSFAVSHSRTSKIHSESSLCEFHVSFVRLRRLWLILSIPSHWYSTVRLNWRRNFGNMGTTIMSVDATSINFPEGKSKFASSQDWHWSSIIRSASMNDNMSLHSLGAGNGGDPEVNGHSDNHTTKP